MNKVIKQLGCDVLGSIATTIIFCYIQIKRYIKRLYINIKAGNELCSHKR